MRPIEKLQKELPENLDGAIILSEYNRRYLTGFPSSDGIVFVTREKSYFLTDFRYIEAARAQAEGCEVILLENRANQLQELVKRHHVKYAGIEAYKLSVYDFNRIKSELPDVRLSDSEELNRLINDFRMIKSAGEIENIRAAQKITDAAFQHVLGMMKPGAAERDIALEIEYFMKKNGAQGPSFDLIVVSGEKSSLPHGVPGSRKLQKGDFVTLDIGAIYNGYCSDMTRTVIIGSVSDEQKKVYDTVLKAQLESEKAIAAGKNCRDIDKIARSLIDNAGYRGCFGHGLGHSVGLEIHEEPRFSPSYDAILRENMIMTVEPGIYLEGKYGVRIEDLVLVTKTGCEIFTKTPKELIVL